MQDTRYRMQGAAPHSRSPGSCILLQKPVFPEAPVAGRRGFQKTGFLKVHRLAGKDVAVQALHFGTIGNARADYQRGIAFSILDEFR